MNIWAGGRWQFCPSIFERKQFGKRALAYEANITLPVVNAQAPFEQTYAARRGRPESDLRSCLPCGGNARVWEMKKG